MKASDVMVTDVITVTPTTSVQVIADMLLSNRISAVPVVDEGGVLIGVVSEGDLLHRVEAGTERRRSWWLDLFSDKGAVARDFLKSHAVKAADVMTKPVITADPDMQLSDLATLLEKHRIKRVPIVKDGKIVGIVSRANLLQALSILRKELAPEMKIDDSTLRERVVNELRSKLMVGFSQINVLVRDGAVELWGTAESTSEKEAIRVAAELVPGVKSVANHVAVQRFHYGM